ncbi:MAG: class I SAM-dependent methyltransferase [Gomphosphaeria aponina SAG 52.96 = DSM 107014]|uniref:Class I SAM-dependent methyltransferase n=1 Tax=Gomphosphaeria aponina SAG 52.96 = DSM 107014 TaxID=1521640 RepID=A0A941JUN8_9CHRO|nr:class I SAM-dependent methyltransferase [Gomphosphaeria aponina SAG 52.96 = DSM 107014]
MSIKNLIREKIVQSPNQRITFAEYMEIVLYHPQYGYYGSGKVKIGARGDFFTSSSLGADFGELLAEQFVEMWEIIGHPAPFTLVEMGAGTGILAQDILAYVQQKYPDFFKNIEYIIIEQSEGLRKQQQNLLQEWEKKVSFFSNLKEMAAESIIGCCFSNELIDAFPVHRIKIMGGKIEEIYVSYVEEQLVEVSGKPSTNQLIEYFNLVEIELSSKAYPDGYCTEVNLAALTWLETVARCLKRGYVLTIDYGYSAQNYYHPQRYQGTLQCYYHHRCHNNPYVNIGEQDITTHADFTALEYQGKLWGLEPVGKTKQGMFLMALGLGARLTALASGKFTFMEVIERRDALHQLINPTGLGKFAVLLQSKRLREHEKKMLKGFNLSE